MTSTAPQRYPLAWPSHRPRTLSHRRKAGQFKTYGKFLNPAEAMDRVQEELDRLGGKNPLLSTNLELRVDGRPRGDRSAPADPGVCLYFSLKGAPIALACDTYTITAQNIAALAKHLEATRAIERYGVATAAESLQAFSALPPPGGVAVRPWREVFGLAPEFPAGLDRDEAELILSRRFRAEAAKAHPDVQGGSAEAMADVNRANDEGKAQIRAMGQ